MLENDQHSLELFFGTLYAYPKLEIEEYLYRRFDL
jgi:hypothetical protein